VYSEEKMPEMFLPKKTALADVQEVTAWETPLESAPFRVISQARIR
jgi:hypothetical protein